MPRPSRSAWWRAREPDVEPAQAPGQDRGQGGQISDQQGRVETLLDDVLDDLPGRAVSDKEAQLELRVDLDQLAQGGPKHACEDRRQGQAQLAPELGVDTPELGLGRSDLLEDLVGAPV